MSKEIIQTFNQTCNKPYDRHNYKLVYVDGRTVIYENYDEVQLAWFQVPNQFLSHVEVLDKKPKKGFK